MWKLTESFMHLCFYNLSCFPSTEFCVRFSRIMFFSFVVSAYKWLYSTSSVQCINIRTAKVSYLSKIICHHQGLNLM